MPNLVGIGLSQVPTNSMLGGLAYQDPEHASIKDLDLKNLSQINSEIADTATNIFVYDTRKDSDGGAWRKRTQHTSWYNETLGTSTRGTRKEFPAVAVLVLSANKLTIYDGDDPDLPMWMDVYQFVNGGGGGTSTNWHGGSGTFSSVAALNGTIVCSATVGCRNLHFINDRLSLFYTPSSGNYTQLGGISNRNDAYSSWGPTDSYYAQLVTGSTNDVAMTVLPNAPIDDNTGLPVPTIAIATAGGVTIIRDDRSVIDYTHDNAPYDQTSFVEFLGDDRVAYAWDNNNTPRRFFITPIRTADTATADVGSYPRDVVDTVGYGGPEDNKSVGNYHGHLIGNDQSVSAAMNGSMIAVGDGSDGLNLVDVQEAGDDTFNSRIAFISKNYNTGWQYGNIKGAFLSDTDATNVSPSSNLVSNGDFANTNLSNYFTLVNSDSNGGSEANSAPYVNGSNQVVMGNSAQLKTSYNLVAGRVYELSYDCVNQSSSAQRLGIYVPSGASLTFDDSITAGGTNTYYYTATSTGSTVIEWRSRGGGWGTYDNFTIIESTELDRSINNKGIRVYGTVTKSAVATGADLVAYGGFSNGNFLMQPPNSDMQTGTGNFSVMCWFKTTSTVDAYEGLVFYNNAGSINKGWQLMMGPSSGNKGLYFYAYGTSQIGTDYVTGYNDGVWHCVVATHTSNQIKIFVDGVLKTTKNHSIGNINNSNAHLTIGRWYGNTNSNYNWRGDLALVRHSASAPSAEQIKKMYNDEKHLFQENAKATLYGSSDAITALAYDDTTNLLYAGTSAGRSEFQGLRRINNTTTAVTTAISASNGLIAEQ